MRKLLVNLQELFWEQIPPAMQPEYRLDCARRNHTRLYLLPYLNILTQFACYVIYLYIYPVTSPGFPRLNQLSFTIFSLIYSAVNLCFLVQFRHLRGQPQDDAFVQRMQHLTLFFFLCYALGEGLATVIEVGISGNIYRFLATFFVAAFLPLLTRPQKALVLTAYLAVVEVGFALPVHQGAIQALRYPELALLFYLVCLLLSSVTLSNHCRSFRLHQELIETNRKLQELIVVDPLTNLNNRRAFNDYIAQLWQECKRNGQALNAMMIDIDNFKQYNDRYGHQMGDACLLQIAALLKQVFARSTDMVARYGGEEFVVLLPYTNRDDLPQLAEQVRQGIEALDIRHEAAEPYGCVTVSMGVASMTPQIEDRYEALIKMADDALYLAKDDGRNCVRYVNIRPPMQVLKTSS